MKQQKLVYYGSAVLIVLILCVILINNTNTPKSQEAPDLIMESDPVPVPLTIDSPPRTTETFAVKEGVIIPIKDKEELVDKNLIGNYWNHPYIRIGDDVEEGDQAIYLHLDKETNTLKLHFEEYLPRVDADGDVEIVTRYDCRMTSSYLSPTTFALNKSKYSCLDEYSKFCFLEKDGLKGISFDGKTISFYQEQKIIPAFDSKTLLQVLFPLYELDSYGVARDDDNTGGYIEFEKIEYYQEQENRFALVFFSCSVPVDYGSRLTDDYHEYLSIAKFKENPKGMYLLEFSENCDCGTYTRNPEFPIQEIVYPTLQKIGNRHFLVKPIEKEHNNIYSTTLYYYNTDNFEEAFNIKKEELQILPSGERVYHLKTTIEYTDENNDCGIIVNYLGTDSTTIAANKRPKKQDIYIYDTEKDIFFKPS